MEKASFDKMRMGYNRYQVDDYIDDLQTQLEEAKHKLALYQQENEYLQIKFTELDDRYKDLLFSLAGKEKMVDLMTKSVIKEANVIIDAANKNADILIRDAITTAQGMLLEIQKLSKQTSEQKDEMYEQIQKIYDVLEQFQPITLPHVDVLEDKIR